MTDVADRADEIFAARGVLDGAQRRKPIFGLREIVTFLTDPTVQLTQEQTRLLFSDRDLASAFRQLKSRYAALALPAMAAASDGDLTDRTFPGGRVRLRPSKRSGQVYLIVDYGEQPPDPSPAILLLEAPDGAVAKLALPGADDQGQLMIILDEACTAESEVVRLLKDPRASGVFMQ